MSEIEYKIYFIGLLAHALAILAYEYEKKEGIRPAINIGQLIHTVAWPVVTPTMAIYIWLINND